MGVPARQKKIIIIAGPNGAGKTTFATEFLPREAGCPDFINMDLIAAGLSPFDPQRAALQAGRIMLEEIRRRVAVMFPPDYNRFPNNFSHIFAGGYGAGYYSYKWAEVLSADAYSLFEESGVLSPEAGHRFWSEILGVGGSRTALESFTAFRGREPSIDALLRHNGMTGI